MVAALTIKEANPAVQRIADMLVKAFAEIGEKIYRDLKKAYREHAHESFMSFLNQIRTRTGKLQTNNRTGRKEYSGWNQYAEIDRDKLPSNIKTFGFETWEDYKVVVDLFRVSYRDADQQADFSYTNARDSFVYKNLDKLREVLGKRTDLKNAVIKFDWRGGYFKGNLQVYLEGAYFQGDVDIKYVVRTIPKVTPYFQYPLVFTDAEVGGKSYARPSEMELRNLLSGKTDEQHAQEKAAQAAAEGWCPMSGKPAEGIKIRYGSTAYAQCPTCKTHATVQHFKWRKHKTKVAEKADATKKLTDAGYCAMSKEQVPFQLIEKFIKPHTVWPGGVETVQYSFQLFDGMGKYRKAACPSCGQNVVVGDSRDGRTPQDVRATFQKHKLKK